jgi:hypothetical protein
MIGASGNLQYLYDHRIDKIAESIITVATASVTFSSIPGTYRHLRLVYQARGDAAVTDLGFQIQLNGDTGTTYDQEYTHLSGAAPTAFAQEAIATTSIRIGDLPAASAPASSAGIGAIEIPNYAGVTFFKNIDARGSSRISNTTPVMLVFQAAGTWKSLAAVNAVKVFPASGNFAAGTFVLYGLN